MTLPIATEVKVQKRRLQTLREQVTALSEAVERDSKKLDELQEKLGQVIDILSQIGPHMAKLPEPPKANL